MPKRKSATTRTPVERIVHDKAKRTNIPTNELGSFMDAGDKAPRKMLYPRDPSLDPQQAADRAAAAGMPVYTIALGTADGTVEVQDPFGQPQQLAVPPDTQTLTAVADTTGGKFFSAPSAEDLAQIYESLGSKVGYTQQEQEITQLFAGAALLFVLAGAGLAAHWFNRFP